MYLLRTLLALVLLATLSVIATAEDAPTPQELCDAAEPAPLTMMSFEAAEYLIDRTIDYRAILCTSAGAIYVELYEDQTPATVNNFVFLAEQGYYDNTTFHRVIPDFMAQGGDPTGTGRGGPGYQFGDEALGYLTFNRPYLLAMANAGPGTNGSQFFITTAPTQHLNYKHTIFGDVLAGHENVQAIRERDPATATEPGETLHTVLIISDSAQVDNRDVVELPPVTQEELIAAFENFVYDEAALYSTADIRAMVPAELQEDFDVFADTYGHQYRYGIRYLNEDCDPEVWWTSVGYQIDVFADRESTAAALQDEFTFALAESDGFITPARTRHLFFMKQTPSCLSEEGWHIMAQMNLGRFLITVDALVDLNSLGQMQPQDLIGRIANQLEAAFVDVYPRELRGP